MTKWEMADAGTYHFFASSASEWRTDTELEALIARMKADRMPFNVFRVELPLESIYTVNKYAPDLPEDKISYVGFWQLRD